MMVFLHLMSILCIRLVFGMDSYSTTPESSIEEKIDLEGYTKQEPNTDDLNFTFIMDACGQKKLINDSVIKKYEAKENSNIKNLSKAEENFDENNELNLLKRKHKSEKILQCEFCKKESTICRKSKIYGMSLCEACSKYQYRHGHLGERKYYKKHRDTIIVCESCQNESIQYTTGKVSGKSLCLACYTYEYRHVNLHLEPLDDKKYGKHKDHILVCEICQQDRPTYRKGKMSGQSLCTSCYGYEYRQDQKNYEKQYDNTRVCEFCEKMGIRYKKGKVSGKTLCESCYQYEYKYDRLVPFNERKHREKYKNKVFACEFCNKESTRYIKGKFSGKILCNACYRYENLHGHLVERKYIEKHQENILTCEFCQKEITNYIKGKFSNKSLCKTCYQYEYKFGHLVPFDERKYGKHKNNILVCEFCQKDSNNYKRGKISGKSLCESCYRYEYRHGHSVPLNKRKNYREDMNLKNDQTYRLIDTKNFQHEEKVTVQDKYTIENKTINRKHDRAK